MKMNRYGGALLSSWVLLSACDPRVCVKVFEESSIQKARFRKASRVEIYEARQKPNCPYKIVGTIQLGNTEASTLDEVKIKVSKIGGDGVLGMRKNRSGAILGKIYLCD